MATVEPVSPQNFPTEFALLGPGLLQGRLTLLVLPLPVPRVLPVLRVLPLPVLRVLPPVLRVAVPWQNQDLIVHSMSLGLTVLLSMSD